MRGVDLYGPSPLRSGREAGASAALFAASATARLASRERPLRFQGPRKWGSSATAARGRCRARLRLERAPRAGLALRPQNTPLKNRITEQN